MQYSNLLRAGRSRNRIPVGSEIFRTCPDRPWGQPSLLYNGYRVFPLQGFDPRTVQPVVSRYTDYAFPTHLLYSRGEKIARSLVARTTNFYVVELNIFSIVILLIFLTNRKVWGPR